MLTINLNASAEQKILSVKNNTHLFISCNEENYPYLLTFINAHASKDMLLQHGGNIICRSDVVASAIPPLKEKPDYPVKENGCEKKTGSHSVTINNLPNLERIRVVVDLDDQGNLVVK